MEQGLMSAPRRVLVQVIGYTLGGLQANAVDLAWATRELGYESILIAPGDTVPVGPSLQDLADARGVQLEPYRRPTSILDGARTLARLAGRHRADIVHAYSGWSFRAAYWGPCLLGRRPLVMTNYEMAAMPGTYRAANLIVGTGYLHDELTTRQRRVDLISPPVDLDRDDTAAVDAAGFLARWDLDPARRRAVVVSRLDEDMKALSIEVMMRAVSRLHRADLDLVIVGDGDAGARLRAAGQAINASAGRTIVTFTGSVADPRPAYAGADIVLGMGSSAARGLAFGKPLIVVGENGLSAMFGPATAAALFRNSFWSNDAPADPVEELAATLSLMLDRQATWADLGVFGRAFAEENFGLRAMAVKLAAVYRDAEASYGAKAWGSELDLEFAAARRHLPGATGRRREPAVRSEPAGIR
jgi:glycosyltransferase involved in cell wall biosynthesis